MIAPDVGGGFGPKAMFYAEEAVIPFLARKLDRPIKWIEDRREHFDDKRYNYKCNECDNILY